MNINNEVTKLGELMAKSLETSNLFKNRIDSIIEEKLMTKNHYEGLYPSIFEENEIYYDEPIYIDFPHKSMKKSKMSAMQAKLMVGNIKNKSKSLFAKGVNGYSYMSMYNKLRVFDYEEGFRWIKDPNIYLKTRSLVTINILKY